MSDDRPAPRTAPDSTLALPAGAVGGCSPSHVRGRNAAEVEAISAAVLRYADAVGAGLVLLADERWVPTGLAGLPLLTEAEAEWEAHATRREFPGNVDAIGLDANEPCHAGSARDRLQAALEEVRERLDIAIVHAEETFEAVNEGEAGDEPRIEYVADFDGDGNADDAFGEAVGVCESGRWAFTRAQLRVIAAILVEHGFPAYCVSTLNAGMPSGFLRVPVRGPDDEGALLRVECGLFDEHAGRWTPTELMRWQDACGYSYAGGDVPPWPGGLAGVTIEEVAAWRAQHGSDASWAMPAELMLVSAARRFGACRVVAAKPGHWLRLVDEHGDAWEFSAASLMLSRLPADPCDDEENVTVDNAAAFFQATGLRSPAMSWLADSRAALAGLSADEAVALTGYPLRGDGAGALQVIAERLRQLDGVSRQLRVYPAYA